MSGKSTHEARAPRALAFAPSSDANKILEDIFTPDGISLGRGGADEDRAAFHLYDNWSKGPDTTSLERCKVIARLVKHTSALANCRSRFDHHLKIAKATKSGCAFLAGRSSMLLKVEQTLSAAYQLGRKWSTLGCPVFSRDKNVDGAYWECFTVRCLVLMSESDAIFTMLGHFAKNGQLSQRPAFQAASKLRDKRRNRDRLVDPFQQLNETSSPEVAFAAIRSAFPKLSKSPFWSRRDELVRSIVSRLTANGDLSRDGVMVLEAGVILLSAFLASEGKVEPGLFTELMPIVDAGPRGYINGEIVDSLLSEIICWGQKVCDEGRGNSFPESVFSNHQNPERFVGAARGALAWALLFWKMRDRKVPADNLGYGIAARRMPGVAALFGLYDLCSEWTVSDLQEWTESASSALLSSESRPCRHPSSLTQQPAISIINSQDARIEDPEQCKLKDDSGKSPGRRIAEPSLDELRRKLAGIAAYADSLQKSAHSAPGQVKHGPEDFATAEAVQEISSTQFGGGFYRRMSELADAGDAFRHLKSNFVVTMRMTLEALCELEGRGTLMPSINAGELPDGKWMKKIRIEGRPLLILRDGRVPLLLSPATGEDTEIGRERSEALSSLSKRAAAYASRLARGEEPIPLRRGGRSSGEIVAYLSLRNEGVAHHAEAGEMRHHLLMALGKFESS